MSKSVQLLFEVLPAPVSYAVALAYMALIPKNQPDIEAFGDNGDLIILTVFIIFCGAAAFFYSRFRLNNSRVVSFFYGMMDICLVGFIMQDRYSRVFGPDGFAYFLLALAFCAYILVKYVLFGRTK